MDFEARGGVLVERCLQVFEP